MNVVILGLDCLAPALVFDRFAEQLPTFSALRRKAIWGKLRSVDPPITIPAWACMMSGYTPGQLGLYGFRHRKNGTYTERYLADGNAVKVPRVWDRLTAEGIGSGLLAIPQTYPPKPVKGFMVSGFDAPDTDSVFTYPDPLREEIEALTPGYLLDVDDFRTDDLSRIAADIKQMTLQRFSLFRHWLQKRRHPFMMYVEIGPDRMHHAFWRFCDPAHRLYEKGHAQEHAIADYYRYLDTELAATLPLIGDDAHLFIVSDHGARAMKGGFCINDWLIARGDLVLKQPLDGLTKFDESLVDWSRTKAWAWGGYYARIFFNVQGREPQGQVGDVSAYAAELTAAMQAVPGPDGAAMFNRVLPPSALSPDGVARGDHPDLLVYFGDLDFRAIGTVGNASFYTQSNDTGPDDANHDPDGVFIYRPPGGHKAPGERQHLSLVDIAPTVLDLFGLTPNEGGAGKRMTLA